MDSREGPAQFEVKKLGDNTNQKVDPNPGGEGHSPSHHVGPEGGVQWDMRTVLEWQTTGVQGLKQGDEELAEVLTGPSWEVAALARKRVMSRSNVMRSGEAIELKVRRDGRRRRRLR